MLTVSFRCYLCNQVREVPPLRTNEHFQLAIIAGFGGHRCKAGRELYCTPFEVINQRGKLEG